jgi:hypothetical protein
MAAVIALLSIAAPALLVVFTPSLAMAQEEEEKRKVIIMPVPYGGTKMLAKKIYALENTSPYPKKWFDEKVESRGFQPDGILQNKKDLRWVMDRTNISLIIDFAYDEETALYTVYFYSPRSGEIAKEFEVGSDEDGLTEDGADKITEEALAFMEGGDPGAKADPDEEKDPDEDEDEELDAKAFARRRSRIKRRRTPSSPLTS